MGGLEVILQILRLGGHFCGDHGASPPPPSSNPVYVSRRGRIRVAGICKVKHISISVKQDSIFSHQHEKLGKSNIICSFVWFTKFKPRVKHNWVKRPRVKRHWVKQQTAKNATKGETTKDQNGKTYFMYYFRVRLGSEYFWAERCG